VFFVRVSGSWFQAVVHGVSYPDSQMTIGANFADRDAPDERTPVWVDALEVVVNRRDLDRYSEPVKG
jgi:hypothetical protein